MRNSKYGEYGCGRNYTHPLYDAWRNMKRRCYLKTANYYKNYGGRGIKVCDEWRTNYGAFLEWSLNNGWEKKFQLDRIDNNGDYSPDNCRWIPQKKNLLNKRTNYYITYQGKKQTITEWAAELGINIHTLTKRVQMWGVDKAFNTPVNEAYKREVHKHEITFRGETNSLKGWADKIGISHVSLAKRIKRWGLERALTEPPHK